MTMAVVGISEDITDAERAALDPAVIAGCRRGDRDALERVLRVYALHLERVLTRILGPGADVEDVLQGALTEIVRAFPRFRGEATVKTWMTKIAVNVARQHLRRPTRRHTVALSLVPDRVAADRPGEAAEHRELLARVFVHLAQVSRDQRVAFALHVLSGYALDEVAALMDASRPATKSRVFWARRKLLARARRDPRLGAWLREIEEGETDGND